LTSVVDVGWVIVVDDLKSIINVLGRAGGDIEGVGTSVG